MSKIFSKTVKKTTLWSVIIAIVLAAAIVVCALLGFNKNVALQDQKTMTVSLNAYIYNTQLEEVKEDLEEKLDANYVLEGSMSGDVSELLFVFDSDKDLTALKAQVETYLADKKANAEGWANAKYSVSISDEEATAVLAKYYVLRAAIAGAVLAVLAFVYVSIRYKLGGGIVAGASVLLAMLLTAGVIVLARVPVTSMVAYAIAVAGLLAAASGLFTLNKIRSAQKEDSLEDTVVASIATKETLYVAAVVAVGIILVGALGGAAALWFAVSALIAVVASVAISLVFAPAMYLSVQTAFDSKPAKTGYKGAVKTSTKTKKVAVKAAKVEAPVEETVEEVAEEAPVEETVEEAAEEAPVEETVEEVAEEAPVEETVEEVAEEAPVEETVEEAAEEAPVEETVEEVAEEAPVEETVEEVAEEAPVEETVEEVAEEAPVEETVEEVAEEAPVEEAVEATEEKTEE